MSTQPHKQPASNNKSLHKRSRNICMIAAAVLYLLFLVGTFGDGYTYVFFFPIFTGVFLIGLAILYFPARACIEKFIDVRLTQKRRYAFLSFALIPYLCCVCFFLFLFIDYNYLSSPEAVAAKAENNFEYYREQYAQNAVLLNQLNDSILNGGVSDNFWQAESLYYYAKDNIIRVYAINDEEKTEWFDLEEFEYFSPQDKENIKTLTAIICRGEHDITFTHNQLSVRLTGRTDVIFIKHKNAAELFGTSSQPVPLDSDWQMITHVWPPAG